MIWNYSDRAVAGPRLGTPLPHAPGARMMVVSINSLKLFFDQVNGFKVELTRAKVIQTNIELLQFSWYIPDVVHMYGMIRWHVFLSVFPNVIFQNK